MTRIQAFLKLMIFKPFHDIKITFILDEAKSLLKKLFEGHSSKEPSELLVKAAAEGNLKQINELFKTRAAKVRRLKMK